MHLKSITPIILILIGAGTYGYIYREEILSPCLPPLHYKIGTVDPQFKISREKFTTLVTKAEQLWEKALGKDFFQYDPNASFSINLVYDERQSKTDQSLELEKEINSQKKEYNQLSDQLNATSKNYDTLVSQYNNQKTSYEKKLADYNDAVKTWNQKGGAPKEEYQKLDQVYQKLDTERQNLNDMIKKINALASASQKTVTTINDTASEINGQVETHNTLFGNGEEFDKGRFNGTDITIYQYVKENDLLLALTHELGHALSIEHTQDPRSIMYYLMKDQPTNPVIITPQDLAAGNQSCKFSPQ